MGAIVSHFKALKASRYFQEAVELEKNGNLSFAVNRARKGLHVLSLPTVNRSRSAAGAVLSQLTLFIEYHAPSLGQAGANESDLKSCHFYISDLNRTDPKNEYAEWLGYIEKRLGHAPTDRISFSPDRPLRSGFFE